MFACAGCGDSLRFSPDLQMMYCRSCGNKYDVNQVEKENVATENSDEEKEFFETTIFSCPQCGGEMIGDETDAAMLCPYCGVHNVLETRLSKSKRPEFIIPFRISKNAAAENLKETIQKKFWVSKKFKENIDVDNFRGIYVPYYAFETEYEEDITLPSTHARTVGNYNITDFYEDSAHIEGGFRDITKDASSSFYDNIAEAIAPFQPEDREFKPQYLSGFYADIADVDEEVYHADVVEYTKSLGNKKVADRLDGFSKGSVDRTKISLNPSVKKCKKTMYPVWFLSYKSGDRIAYATVNGQTGRVAADLPVDMLKFVLLALGIALPVFGLLCAFLTLKPDSLIALLLLSMSFIMLSIYLQQRDVFVKEYNVGDRGLSFINPDRDKRLGSLEKHIDKKREKEYMKAAPKTGGAKKGAATVFIWLAIVFGNGLVTSIGGIAVAAKSAISDMGGFIAFVAMVLNIVFLCIHIGRVYISGWGRALGILNLVISVISTIFVLAGMPTDAVFYGIAVLLMALMLGGYGLIVSGIKRLTTRPLPQFKKKGGMHNDR